MNSRTKDIETVFRHGFGRLPNFENKLPEPEKVAICKKWLSENAKRKRVPKDECINSYGLKHRIEEEVGEYITNGACIQAAIELGFAYWRGFADWRGEDFINARFYMELNIKPENRLEKAIGFSKWLFEQDDLYFYGDPPPLIQTGREKQLDSLIFGVIYRRLVAKQMMRRKNYAGLGGLTLAIILRDPI